MSLFLQMCLSFIKVGAFTFGGGYAAIGLIQNEIIENHHWLTNAEFADIAAIAEMTPGPIALNTATFVGYKLGGTFYGIACSVCIITVPVIVSLLVAFSFEKLKNKPWLKTILKGIRPAAIGLIAAAGIKIAKAGFTSAYSLLFFAFACFIIFKLKKSPIIALLACGALGMLLFSVLAIV